jgi:hypothetical protein
VLRRILLAPLALAAFASISAAAGRADAAPSPSITFDADKAILAGTGCAKGVDAFVSTNGNDVSVIATNLGFDLYEGSPHVSAMSSCILRMPANIALGLWVSAIHQRAGIGITKSADASVSFASTASVFGFPVSPVTRSYPSGSPMDEPEVSVERVDQFLVNTPWWSGWCNPSRAQGGLFQASLNLYGQRSSHGEVIAYVDGHYDVTLDLETC